MADDSERHLARTMSFGIPDTALGLVMGFLDDPWDRDAISLVCRHWCKLDADSRKHVTIAMAYSTTPGRLLRCFPCLEWLKLKAKPRAAMFNLIPDNWGGSASPWIRELSASFGFLKELHLRRMIVSDDDLAVLVHAKAHMLVSLKLDRCFVASPDPPPLLRSLSLHRTVPRWRLLDLQIRPPRPISERAHGEQAAEMLTSVALAPSPSSSMQHKHARDLHGPHLHLHHHVPYIEELVRALYPRY